MKARDPCQKIKVEVLTPRDSGGLKLNQYGNGSAAPDPTHLHENQISVTQSSASPWLPPAQLSLGSCPNSGLKGAAPQQTTFYPLLLKSPPRRKPCFCSKDIPRQEMDSRHHECLITLIVQVQFTPHSLSTLWETVIKCEMAHFYYSLAQSSQSAGESVPVRARHPLVTPSCFFFSNSVF